jgi:hypothetical protein
MALDEPSQEDSSATTQGPVCCRQRSGTLLTKGGAAHAPRTNTAVSISTRPPRSRVADSDPCVNGSRDRRASPTHHIEDNRIRRCASGLGCDRPTMVFASVVRIAFAPWSAFACWSGHRLAMPTSMSRWPMATATTAAWPLFMSTPSIHPIFLRLALHPRAQRDAPVT